MIEEWKFYKETYCTRYGHRIYEVSNYGNVKINGEIIIPKLCGNYYTICHKYLHRIVAELFIPNPDNKPYIDHINTITTDNRVENLRWVTNSENMLNPITRKKMSQSLKIVMNTEIVKQKLSVSHIRKKLSDSHKQKLSAAHKGKIPKNKGVNLTPAQKEKISSACKKYWTDEKRAERSTKYKGSHNPVFGKHWRLENGKRIYY